MIVCGICGVTLRDNNSWQGCRKHELVCTSCCRRCEHHIEYAGLHNCRYENEALRKRKEITRLELKKRRNEYIAKIAEESGDLVTASVRRIRAEKVQEEIDELRKGTEEGRTGEHGLLF